MSAYATVDESRDRLHCSGWSFGEFSTATCCIVTGNNGENQIKAGGHSQAEAWWNACLQARAVGMLAPVADVCEGD
jgi:hypothetical protein